MASRDKILPDNEGLAWNLKYGSSFQDWELEAVDPFLACFPLGNRILYDGLNISGNFNVKSYSLFHK